MRALAIRPGTWTLGQVGMPFPGVVAVLVADPRGKPFAGETVLLRAGARQATATTDDEGVARFDAAEAGPGPYEALFTHGGVTLTAKIPREGGSGAITFPVCAPEPLVKGAEAIAGGAGLALALAGFFSKVEPLQVTGEILIGATVFSLIQRHAC